MITFTPALCQTTTIALPTSLSAGKDSHLVRFKASFGSRDEYEQAKRDGVRVEMWTNLETVGGPAVGAWHALAFDYASPLSSSGEYAEVEGGSVISFLPNGFDGRPEEVEAAAFLDVRVPGDVFSYFEHPRYSFTYRLVYRSGHIEWLGAFGYDGVLAFEPKDIRITFREGCQVSTTGGGYIVESQVKRAVGVGRLGSHLVWEKWSFAGNGPSFSRSHVTSPSGCIILTPSPAPGTHNLTPEALQPMILTAGNDGSSLSISESGDITLHPAAEAPYQPAGLTAVGARMLALGKDSDVLDYDTTSDTVVVTSTTSQEETPTSPVCLSIIPIGIRPQSTTHIDVRVDSEKLAAVFPGSDIVLYQHTPAQKFKVISTSDRKECFVSIRIKASGDQVFVAPLHDLSILSSPGETDVVRPVDVWQVAVVSPHVSARVISELHDVASVFPTPPPSPPLRTYVLGNPLDSAPSIDSVLSSIIEEDEVAEEAPSEAASPTISPSSTAVSQDLKEALLSPAPSSIFDVPRYITSQTFDASPKSAAVSTADSLHALLQLNIVSLIYALFGRAFAILSFILRMFGLDIGVFASPPAPVHEDATMYVPEEVEVKATSVTAAESEADADENGSDRDDEVLSEGTAFEDETAASPNSTSDHPKEISLPEEPLTKSTSQSSYLTVALSSESPSVSLLLCPPKSEDTPSLPSPVELSVDGKAAPYLSWAAVDSTSYLAELRGESGPLGGELKISIDA